METKLTATLGLLIGCALTVPIFAIFVTVVEIGACSVGMEKKEHQRMWTPYACFINYTYGNPEHMFTKDEFQDLAFSHAMRKLVQNFDKNSDNLIK